MALLNRLWRRGAAPLGWLLGALGSFGLLGCGTQGSGEPLADKWPRTALRSFVLRDAEQPYALLRLGWDLDQPTVAPRLDEPGVPLVVWGRMSPRQEANRGVLFRAAVTDLGAAAPPELGLAPEPGWEGAEHQAGGDRDAPVHAGGGERGRTRAGLFCAGAVYGGAARGAA